MELTGAIKWIFIVCVLGTSCLVMIMGALWCLTTVYEWAMNKVFYIIRPSRYIIEYVYYRKEFKEWLKKKKEINKNVTSL